MVYKIITNPEANKDIVNSFEYYKNVAGKKVANSFFKDFKFTVNKLKKVVYFQKIHNDFHRLPLKNIHKNLRGLTLLCSIQQCF